MFNILLTHPPLVRSQYYNDQALAALETLGQVRRNPQERELDADELIEVARGCEILVTHRHVPADHILFASLPQLVAFWRCAVDIRNVDVAAASAQGVLVTHASAGFTADSRRRRARIRRSKPSRSVSRCALAGKHVLLEKPLEITTARTQALVAACRGAGVAPGIVPQHSRKPAVLIDSARSGTPVGSGPAVRNR